MNILILTSWYPDSDNKVSGIFVYEQVNALKKMGLNPVVFYPFDKTLDKNQIVRKEEDGTIIYRANTDYMRSSKLSRINSIIKSLKYLDEIVKENNIQLIHSHVCYLAGFISALYNKHHKNVHFIITEHSSKVGEYSRHWYDRKILEFSYNRADWVITVSSSLASELKELGYTFRSKIIGNVVDTDDYHINSLPILNNEYKLLFIGLMGDNEVKGVQYLLPAFRNFIMNNKQYKVKLTLAGGGSKLQEYIDMSRKLSIQDYCDFKGTVTKDQINALIMENDILISSSIKETFGSVLIEAMAGGKPVLATKCGGPEEFVNDEVGMLVDPKDEKALEDGILSIIKNYNKFDANLIREYAVKNFSYDAIGKKLMDTYVKILRNDGEI